MIFFPFSHFKIYGRSMLPTLTPGQSILCFNWAYLFASPKIGEMVVIKLKGREMVKRIKQVQNDLFFVMGDNQKESTDSREFGAIKKSNIHGKVIFIG